MEMSLVAFVLGILAVPLLVLANAFFVAAEFALVAVRRTRVAEMVNQRLHGAPSVQHAIDHMDDTIAATQLGITLASLALGWIGEPTLAGIIQPALEFLPDDWRWFTAHGLAITIAFVAITTMHIILGELVPKAIALQRPDALSLWLGRPLWWFVRVMRPFIVLVTKLGNGVIRLCGYQPLTGHQMVHSVEELALLIDEVRRAGVLPRDQAEYVYNVFRLPAKKVGDCLVPRERVAALELHLAEEQVLAAVRDGAHTRMPVYDRELDNVVGIVNTKDLFHLFSLRGIVILDDAMYPPIFVLPDRPISEVLREFRRTRRPMAVVRDAAARVLGIITLEDIVEEIVGEIEDEHDVPRRPAR